MTLADSSFWIALSFPRHLFHLPARTWFNEQTLGNSVLFCRSTQQSFLRLLTTDAVARPYGITPMTNSGAWDFYHTMLADRRCGFASEPGGLEEKWASYAQVKSVSPKLWMDAYLAAFASAGGYELISTDAGFRQFTGLKMTILEVDGEAKA